MLACSFSFSAEYNDCYKVFVPLCLFDLSVCYKKCGFYKQLIGIFHQAFKHCNKALEAFSQSPKQVSFTELCRKQ